MILRGGARIPDGMRMIISADNSLDSQIVPIQPDGGFQFIGLPNGGYEISPAVRGYVAAEPNGGLSVDHDINDFRIVLEPDSRR